jgi:molecular chaperone GrpE
MTEKKNSPVGEKKEPSFASSSVKTSEDEKVTEGEGKKSSIEELPKKLEECQKQKDEYLKGWQRARADFLNYKKDEMERIEGFLKYVNEELILKFLPILDNFEKAEKETPEDLKNNQCIKGILQIKTQIQDFLKSQGIKEIESIGKKVDLNLHEIVGETEAKGKESGIIVEEIQKGYLIGDKLLRVAKVKIAK